MNITNDWIEQLHVKEQIKKSMNSKEYQEVINKTAIFPEEVGLAYCTMGLTGEAGEVSDKVKKLFRDKDYHITQIISEEDKLDIMKEIGDVQWYIAALCKILGCTLEEVMAMNYEKLILRRSTNTLHGSGDNRELTK